MWIFTRISGLGMILLALSRYVWGVPHGRPHPARSAGNDALDFFPNPNHVVNSDIPDVTIGWATAFWQIMQMLMVFFGVTHGFNGLRIVVEDFIGQSFFAHWRAA